MRGVNFALVEESDVGNDLVNIRRFDLRIFQRYEAAKAARDLVDARGRVADRPEQSGASLGEAGTLLGLGVRKPVRDSHERVNRTAQSPERGVDFVSQGGSYLPHRDGVLGKLSA